MDGYFDRILGIVQKTGDRVIVVDPTKQQAYVVMGLDQYESIMDLQSPKQAPAGFTEEDFDLVDVDEVMQTQGVAPMPDASIWEVMTDAPKQDKEPSATWDLAKLSASERRDLEQAFYAQKKAERGVVQEEVGVKVDSSKEKGEFKPFVANPPTRTHTPQEQPKKPVSSPEESFYLGSVE